MVAEGTEILLSATLEEAGPTEVSEPVIEYGFISRLIRESGSDQSERSLHSEVLQAIPRREMVYETAIAAHHRVDVSDQDINNLRRCVESGEASLPVDTHHMGSCIESGYASLPVDALQSVCPQESTTAKDVPNDGETCEMECYVGKSVDEAETCVSMSVTHLLCISGEVNGVPVKFLVDSGASGNFISEHLVSEHDLRTMRSHEKMQVHLADGSMRASNCMVKDAQVSYEEHAEFLDFHVMKLPKYDAILGKPWLDRWNPSIDWRAGTISI